MENQQRKIILNPVLSAPWTTQNYGSPISVPESVSNHNNDKNVVNKSFHNRRQRVKNIETLLKRFPDLKKYQAKAALTMSKNILDKAIVLLEVSNCYRTELMDEHFDDKYLKNIHINMEYNCEKQDPTARNICFEKTVATENGISIYRRRLEESVGVENIPPTPNSEKVGVVITRTLNGYKATPFLRHNSL